MENTEALQEVNELCMAHGYSDVLLALSADLRQMEMENHDMCCDEEANRMGQMRELVEAARKLCEMDLEDAPWSPNEFESFLKENFQIE